jgi:hypothetical protein
MRPIARALTWLLLERTSVLRASALGGVIAASSGYALFLAAEIDQNFRLPHPDVGLFQHPGLPVILLADFLVLFLSAAIANAFLLLARKLPTDDERSTRKYLDRVVARGRAAILLNGPSAQMFLYCAGIGALFWAINAFQTLDPVKYYANDVFDSIHHKASYLVMRLILGLSWVVLYPYCAVLVFSAAGNIFSATNLLRSKKRLSYKTFHPDRSGGYSYIGNISFLSIMAMLALFCALASVMHTHQKLNLLHISGLIILTVSFLSATYLITWPTVGFLLEKRRTLLVYGYKAATTSSRSIPLLTWLVLGESFSPYSPIQRILINAARVGTVVATAHRLWSIA